MIRVSLIEDHTKARESLGLLVGGSDGFTLLSSHPNAEHALARLPELRPDVVLTDIKLPGLSGVECVRQLKRVLPATQFVMLTAFTEDDLIFESLKAGASGYLLKRTPPAQLLEAIAEVARGGSPMTGTIARRLVDYFRQATPPPADAGRLSPREQEVLNRLAEGLRYKEIAGALGVSYDTVRAHIRSIYHKLEVNSRAEAVARWNQ